MPWSNGSIPGTHGTPVAEQQRGQWVKTRASVMRRNGRKSAVQVEPHVTVVRPLDAGTKAAGATSAAGAHTAPPLIITPPPLASDKWGTQKITVFTQRGACRPCAGLHSSLSAAHAFVHGFCRRLRHGTGAPQAAGDESVEPVQSRGALRSASRSAASAAPPPPSPAVAAPQHRPARATHRSCW